MAPHAALRRPGASPPRAASRGAGSEPPRQHAKRSDPCFASPVVAAGSLNCARISRRSFTTKVDLNAGRRDRAGVGPPLDMRSQARSWDASAFGHAWDRSRRMSVSAVRSLASWGTITFCGGCGRMLDTRRAIVENEPTFYFRNREGVDPVVREFPMPISDDCWHRPRHFGFRQA